MGGIIQGGMVGVPYVGMIIVVRAEQYLKALSDMITREVGRNTLPRLELSTTTTTIMIIR